MNLFYRFLAHLSRLERNEANALDPVAAFRDKRADDSIAIFKKSQNVLLGEVKWKVPDKNGVIWLNTAVPHENR